MLRRRVIPCLLLDSGRLIKTQKFANPKYVGDPINAIRIFNDKEVDELIVLDIGASKARREPDYALIEQFAGECFMPLCYGGGIRSLDQAKRLFALGVEKLCLQTAAYDDPDLVTRIAAHVGSSSVVVSVDVKRNWRGAALVYRSATGTTEPTPWVPLLQRMVAAGAGEIVINAVDRDGTMAGIDVDMIRTACQAVQVPVIAVGGVGTLADIKAAVRAGASGVAAGAFFVFHGPHRAVLITYPRYQELETLLGDIS